jgi:CubicO group peptidase (beta-lactamase class C family)
MIDEKPEALGLDGERLGRIPRFFQAYVDDGRLAGAVSLVSRRGQVVHAEAIGSADLEAGAPMALDTIFRIYSMTKPITSVALLSLYEEGRFQLDDPVSRFIPAFADLRVWGDGNALQHTTTFPEREMTVRDLLTHTSGLTYGFMGRHPVDALYRRQGIGGLDKAGTLASMVEALSELPLLFSPGSRWSYSVATDVCGHLVEVLSGQTLDRFFAERIFEPLGMVDTGFSVPDDALDRFAACYQKGPDGRAALVDAPGTSDYRQAPSFLSGGGGLVSTAGDYHRFCRMLLQKGELDGARILGRKTVELMTANHLPGGGDLTTMGQAVFSETSYAGIGFGLGVSVMLDPATAQVTGTAGEYAWGGAASTMFWVDPEEELIGMLLTQLLPSGCWPIRREMRTLAYSALVD